MAQLQTKQHMVSINWEAEQEEHYEKIKKNWKGVTLKELQRATNYIVCWRDKY